MSAAAHVSKFQSIPDLIKIDPYRWIWKETQPPRSWDKDEILIKSFWTIQINMIALLIMSMSNSIFAKYIISSFPRLKVAWKTQKIQPFIADWITQPNRYNLRLKILRTVERKPKLFFRISWCSWTKQENMNYFHVSNQIGEVVNFFPHLLHWNGN